MRREATGSRIRAARIENGLKPIDVAHALGVSSSSINKWELGRQPVAPDILARLAPILGVDAGYLAGGERPGQANPGTGRRLLEILANAQEQVAAAAGVPRGRVELVLTFRGGRR